MWEKLSLGKLWKKSIDGCGCATLHTKAGPLAEIGELKKKSRMRKKKDRESSTKRESCGEDQAR